jgi:hypothetical protein
MKRLAQCLWFLGALAFGSISYAQDEGYLREGMKISAARSAILENGWAPNPSKRSREEPMWRLERQLYQRGFKEVDRCAMDRPVCIFKYKKSQTCLEVELEGLKISNMRIIGWSRACEPDS